MPDAANNDVKHCSCCGSELPNVGDLPQSEFCERCKDNTERRQFFAELKLESEQLSLSSTQTPKIPLKSVLEGREGEKLSQADKLILLFESQEPTLFVDQTDTPYIRIDRDGINITLSVRTKEFRTWLASLLWKAEQKAPSTQAISSALNIVEAKARESGTKITLYNRVAPDPLGEGFWIDMANDKWQAIHITSEGWKIENYPPILFKRYSHQLPLTIPKAGGDAWKLLEFLNIDPRDEKTRLALLCNAISYIIPTIPHPILVVYGLQGSGKTWLFMFLRRLIDPSAIEVLSLPWEERERVQQLDHHWLAFYDNITSLPTAISDTLCRAATGSGFSKRELYSDDDDVIYNYRRCIGLNGINIAAQRGDLLDRALLVGLQDIPKDRRRTEKQLQEEFNDAKAEILGGFLDVLVEAIRIYPTINPSGLFRMADFTRWGCCIAVALGKTKDDFLQAYEDKVKTQIGETAHSSPVATVLLEMLATMGKWEGTPSELYLALLSKAEELRISPHQKSFPKAPHILVRMLNELAPSLKMLGYEVVTGLKAGATRKVSITSVSSVPNVQNEDKGSKDASDTTLTSSSRGVGMLEKEVSQKIEEIAVVANPSIIAEKNISQPNRTCGDCLNHWKPSCEMDNFGMILPTATYADTCKAFVPKQSEATT